MLTAHTISITNTVTEQEITVQDFSQSDKETELRKSVEITIFRCRVLSPVAPFTIILKKIIITTVLLWDEEKV